MSAPLQPPTPVTLATLGSQYGVLPTTPAWPAVTDALEDLRGPNSDRVSDDRRVRAERTVDEFAAMLSRSAETVALSIICAAHVGRMLDSMPAQERIARGMQLLSETFRFRDLEARDVTQALNALISQITDNVRPFAVLTLDGLRTLDGVQRWQERLGDALRTVKPLSTDESGQVIADAWKNTLSRLDAWITQRISVVPSLAELETACAKIAPGSIIAMHVGAMSIADLSDAFYAATESGEVGVPPFIRFQLGVAALACLGFRLRDQNDLPQWLAQLNKAIESAEATAAQVKPRWLYGNPAPAGLIIVRRHEGSRTLQWTPSPDVAAVALDILRITRLATEGARVPNIAVPSAPSPYRIAIELEDDLTASDMASHAEIARRLIPLTLVKSESARGSDVVFFGETNTPPEGFAWIPAPTSVSELAGSVAVSA